MKIDKRNYRHWLYLLRGGAYSLVSLLFRPLRNRSSKRVILYGHKLNGNLKAFADYWAELPDREFELYFLTLDPNYYRELKLGQQPVKILCMQKLGDMVKVAQSGAVITDHGPQVLMPYLRFTQIKFINVWHGIGWKGHYPEEFAFVNAYADNWVSSESFKKIYRNVFGIGSPIHVTGYARSDDTVNHSFSVDKLRSKYQISKRFKKIILVAPTWAQSHGRHSIFPFNESAGNFFKVLNSVAARKKSLVIFRTHLNTHNVQFPFKLNHVAFMSYNAFPEVEDFLYMSDILVSDWSSIVFDYLPLNRPTIFLDVPQPYDRLCMDANLRFGDIVSSVDTLSASIEKYLDCPASYVEQYERKIAKAIEVGYGDTLDGESAKRYVKQLERLLK